MNSDLIHAEKGAPAPAVRSADPYEAFREELRRFAEANCPAETRAIVATGGKLTRHEYSAWQKILHGRGWAAPGWPTEYGGTGWDLKQRQIFEEVMAEADCPPLYHHGLGHIGPVIIEFGTPEQRKRFLASEFRYGDRLFHAAALSKRPAGATA